jgi:hypothetical protein
MKRSWGLLSLLLALAACGGGGSSSPPPLLSFAPGVLTASFFAGDSVPLELTATPSAAASGTVYVEVVDSVGVIVPTVAMSANPNGSYSVTLMTSPNLAAGRYQGALQVRLCRDNVCASQVAGSPVAFPYDFQVAPGTNLTPLMRWGAVNDWETFQGNAGHTGYVPVSLDAAKFSRRWRWLSPDGRQVKPVSIADGSVFVATSGYFAPSNLFALSEADKSVRWTHDFGSVFALNPPAARDGKVFVATSGHENTFMWSFDAATGAQLFKTSFSAQWEHYYAPTVDAANVYTNGGYYGGLVAFNKANGTTAWFSTLSQYDQWTPAVDANYLYAYLGESCGGCANAGLTVLDKTTGAVVKSIPDSLFSWSGWSINGAPIIGSNGSVIMVNGPANFGGNRLISFDVANGVIAWAVSGAYQGNPAVANGVVYATTKSPFRLEARRESDGALLWTWTPSDLGAAGFYGNVIVTDNLVFLSTDKKVHAISLASHASVWTYPQPGELAISANGVLYIATSGGTGSDGGLTAVNLQ